MYDTIETSDKSSGEASKTISPLIAQRRLWIIAAIAAGLAALIVSALWTSRTAPPQKPDDSQLIAQRSVYIAALTEPDAAVRRARLADFIETHPDSLRHRAAKAQLLVLNTAEARDWAKLSDVIFDVRASRPDKLYALEVYERQWDPSLLGGRADAVKRLRDELSAEAPDIPVRDEGIELGNISPSERMVGGGKGYPRPESGVDTSAVDTAPYPQSADIITPPELRREVQPRYPRRALNAGIEAVVELRLILDDRGRVEAVELMRADAPRYKEDFIEAAERAARRFRFEPREINGEPVPTPEGITKQFVFKILD